MNANDPTLNEFLAMDAIETAWNALNSYEGTKTDEGLQSLVRVLWAAAVHFGHKDGRTQKTREAFYEELADFICEEKMEWMCDMHSRELLAALEKRDSAGYKGAEDFLYRKFEEDCLGPEAIHTITPEQRIRLELCRKSNETLYREMLPGFY